MIQNPEGFLVERVCSVDDTVRWWPFLAEGLAVLNQIPKDGAGITKEAFLSTVVTATADPERNIVAVVKSKNGKPLHFGIVVDNSLLLSPPSLLIYASYSNGKSKTVTKWALQWLEDWAREHGYAQLEAFSMRITGASFRLFERGWGFRRKSVLFTKTI